jgi:transcription factor C subunit 7
LGQVQAEELASHAMKLNPEVDIIYSSPFYRCIQTIHPLAEQLKKQRDRGLDIHGEPGLGEWYGMHRTGDPVPASPEVLKSFFPMYSQTYKPIWVPDSKGECIRELHDRAAYTLAGIIQTLDKDPTAPKSILICTHAATFMALSRALTGRFPDDISAQDFYPWTASLSTFKRRTSVEITAQLDSQAGDALPDLNWRNGNGVGGVWECVINGDCSFLSGGEDRGW